MSKFMDRTISVDQTAHDNPEISMRGLSAVKQVLVFTGSKGGVGRTTTVVNLAKTLVQQGLRVGIIDTSGSAELLLASSPVTESTSQKPMERSGISIVSFFHLKQSQLKPPLSTPTIKNILLETFDQTAWGKLDFLFIDLPSGNMELALFIGKILPESKFLLVTTPPAIALAELKQDIHLLEKHQITPWGLIENMSYFVCEHSLNPLELLGIFSAGGAQRISGETTIPLLATIPINLDITSAAEAEEPVYEQCPSSEIIAFYHSLAEQILSKL